MVLGGTHRGLEHHEGSLIDRGTPTVVPLAVNVLNLIDVASLLFGGTAVFDAQCRLFGGLSLKRLGGTQGDTLRRLCVHQLRHTGGASSGVHALDHHGFEVTPLAKVQDVTHLHLLGWFGRRVVDFDAAFLNFFTGQRTGFKKNVRPIAICQLSCVRARPLESKSGDGEEGAKYRDHHVLRSWACGFIQ